MADDFLDLLYDTPAAQTMAPVKNPRLAVTVHAAAKPALTFGAAPAQTKSKFVSPWSTPWRGDPYGQAAVPAQDIPKPNNEVGRLFRAAPAAASVAPRALKKNFSSDDTDSIDAEVPEIAKPKTPARGSAATCIDGAKVEEEVPREFRKVFSFSFFNKMQSACLPAVSEFNLVQQSLERKEPINCFSSSNISI